MRAGRGKLPVVAKISGPGPAPGQSRPWSLSRVDLEALADLSRALDERIVLVAGEQAPAAAAALAAAAGAAGRRTVLLECDLRQPRLAADLGLAAAPGLHEYLRWEATAPEILQPLVLAGPAAAGSADPLVCVVGGKPTTDPRTLVGLESFRHALAKLRDAYDLVILSGPPAGSGDGALEAVAAQADSLLLAAPPSALGGRQGRDLRTAVRGLPVEVRGAIAVGAG